MMKKNAKRAFALMYALMGVGITFILVSAGFGTALTSLKASRNEEESLKAFYAADTGIECARFYQNHFRAFDTTSPEASYNCGIGADFLAGQNPPTAECQSKTYDFRLDGFSNGSCTDIHVEIIPRTIVVNGVPQAVCDLRVFSSGKNSCSAAGVRLVERVRWENF